MGYSKLSIVIPVYNEINTIHEILRQGSAVEISLEKEIILVDDCSTDGTRAVLEKIKIDFGSGYMPDERTANFLKKYWIKYRHILRQ